MNASAKHRPTILSGELKYPVLGFVSADSTNPLIAIMGASTYEFLQNSSAGTKSTVKSNAPITGMLSE